MKLKNLAFQTLKCICEFSNVRSTIFESKDSKCEFVHNFARNMILLLDQNQATGNIFQITLLSNVRLLRELLRTIMKFQSNFGVRTLIATQVQGLMDQYLHHLYEFTVACLKTKLNNKRQIMSEVMAHLNQVWHRLSFETI